MEKNPLAIQNSGVVEFANRNGITVEDALKAYNEYTSSNFGTLLPKEEFVDDMLDFAGISSIRDVRASQKRWAFSIENDTDNDLVLGILPGSYDVSRFALPDASAPNPVKMIGGGTIDMGSTDIVKFKDDPGELASKYNIDIILDNGLNGVIYKDATGEVKVGHNRMSPRAFIDYLKSGAAIEIFETQISSSNEQYYDQNFKHIITTPMQPEEVEEIAFSDYIRPENNNTKKIIVPYHFALSARSILTTLLPAKTKVTYTFKAGFEAHMQNKVRTIIETLPVMR